MNGGILTIDDIASKNTPAIVDYLNEKAYVRYFLLLDRILKNIMMKQFMQ